MLLQEMFSAIGAPKDEQAEIDWLDDLKFFIDNNNNLLTNYFFPAVDRHKKHLGHPSAYKIYIKPLEKCKEIYCDNFEIDSPELKFTKEKLIELAKKIAEEQEKIIKRGDYEN